KPWERE
uniref:Tryptophyllin-T2-8 n=1 Tax=Pithecopus azureus TaxID=2034991 RepID=TY28_PITAZ|nr:RecName: Full=Tryptophyllin-T2-8; Short=Pha-T2-8; AltName: Full=Tryptophyllin-12 [Pithecopus azureus]